MNKIYVDFSKNVGKIKPMHAVNNGPIVARSDQTRGNADTWAKCGIPYARNHDAAFCSSYGGEHSVDISAVFPDFDADVNDPASYDFHLTDEYIQKTLDAGTETFYRLGQKIEHSSKKYHIFPPKDFKKWAQICEHIIMHINYGWADGHNFGIKYWEIWNEPDLDPDDRENRRTWGGKKAQFFDLYEVVAKHLKERFPDLKIGGPALAGKIDWAEDFLRTMQERNVPMDFFSWHVYFCNIEKFIKKSEDVHALLVKYGYGDVESICNEWNYVKNWADLFIYSIEVTNSIKGAAHVGATMLAGQKLDVDMLMYYDARPCVMNGLYNFYTLRPQKPYYTMFAFSQLYKYGTEVKSDVSGNGIYAVAAKDADDNRAVMISCYTDDDLDTESRKIQLDLKDGSYELYRIDKDHDLEKTAVVSSDDIIEIVPNTLILLKNVHL